MLIRGSREIREAYQSPAVARDYMEERFTQPLGALLHDAQVRSLQRIVGPLRRPQVLEIAPGPARLSAEIAPMLNGALVLLDSSAEMLTEARRRVGSRANIRITRGDVFALPFHAAFDLVFSFRLIRHFEVEERTAIYRQIAGVLKPGGLLVFDAVNERVSGPLRAHARPDEYLHYDALLRPEQLDAELTSVGFHLESLQGVHRRYWLLRRLQILVAPRSRRLARTLMNIAESLRGGEPLEWIVTCRRS